MKNYNHMSVGEGLLVGTPPLRCKNRFQKKQDFNIRDSSLGRPSDFPKGFL